MAQKKKVKSSSARASKGGIAPTLPAGKLVRELVRPKPTSGSANMGRRTKYVDPKYMDPIELYDK